MGTRRDKEIHALARAMCRDSGQDPDADTFGSFPRYYEYVDSADEMLRSLEGRRTRVIVRRLIRTGVPR